MSSDLDNEIQPIVLDNGSGSIRVGFAGDDTPHTVIPNIIGYSRDTTRKESFIGDKALEYKNMLNLRYPMEHGIVTNWDDMETIWRYAFHQKLGIQSFDRHPILVSEAVMNPIGNREKMVQTLFEHFQVPAICLSKPNFLTIVSSGRHAALALESGDGVTSAVACEGTYIEAQSVIRQDFAGRDLTDYLTELLAERGYSFTTTAEREIVRDIKEKLAYVALDFEEELVRASHSKHSQTTYKLPDGQEIVINDERFRCVEALFQPRLAHQNELGIAQVIYETLMKNDVDSRQTFQHNILLTGGTTVCPGFRERLEKELKILFPGERVCAKIISWNERFNGAWIGGSILASLSSFSRECITKQEYDESGPSIVHRKVRLI